MSWINRSRQRQNTGRSFFNRWVSNQFVAPLKSFCPPVLIVICESHIGPYMQVVDGVYQPKLVGIGFERVSTIFSLDRYTQLTQGSIRSKRALRFCSLVHLYDYETVLSDGSIRSIRPILFVSPGYLVYIQKKQSFFFAEWIDPIAQSSNRRGRV